MELKFPLAPKPDPETAEKGWLRQYRTLVQPLSRGAVLGERKWGKTP